MTRRASRRPRGRRGFALIAILWLVAALAALGLDDSATAREAISTSSNRMSARKARWESEGCADAVRAAVDAALDDSRKSANVTWNALDSVLTERGALPDWCSVTAAAAGDRLDVNAANADALRAAFTAAGKSPDRADSLADALLDWRDADSLPRPRGVEAAWYRANARIVPSNRPFESADEIRLVRGFEASVELAPLLGVEPGRVVLDRAPLPVIASLPGFSAEAVARIAEMRWRHEPVGDLTRLSAALSDESRRELAAALPVLAQRVAAEPDAWFVQVSATAGDPPIREFHELRLVRAGRRAGVTRERMWP